MAPSLSRSHDPMQSDSQRSTLSDEVAQILKRCGVEVDFRRLSGLFVRSPIDGKNIGCVGTASVAEVERAVDAAHRAFLQWRLVPAPRRGELIRLLGERLREAKTDLGRLVSIEVGKIVSEGLGEVQEMIDICDFAVGQSRQLYGLTMTSERPSHRMMETWHPLGVCGVVSSFNFPVAVWAWNAALAIVCGDSVVWKPSEKTPLTALAAHALFDKALDDFGSDAPRGLLQVVIGAGEIGEALVCNARVPIVSATGSTAMGRKVGPVLAARFARPILELGGNNAAIVTASADLDLALRGVAFAAMGTAGQRCTTLRRLFVHSSVYASFVARLKSAFESVAVGSPLNDGTLVGPLIDESAWRHMQAALAEAIEAGGVVLGGERASEDEFGEAFYARPALVEMPTHRGPVLRETFAPILYVLRYDDFEQALQLQNAVGAGLSSSIFTNDMREAERFIASDGSDCGIANINIGPSGAEIGGAFGGEKETGGGRESGSDSWKAYMRRATNTVNFGRSLALAQGVQFDVGSTGSGDTPEAP